jgi:hypothetical protein
MEEKVEKIHINFKEFSNPTEMPENERGLFPVRATVINQMTPIKSAIISYPSQITYFGTNRHKQQNEREREREIRRRKKPI